MADKKPIFTKQASSIRADGSRNYVHPADVKGRFTRRRNLVFAVLIAIYMLLPWIDIGGHPAVFLDIAARRFYLFGYSFNAQDIWLSFFLLSGLGFALFVMTALWGRIWCGYACPHTVFLDGVFRRIERWIEGPRNKRLRRNAGPWNADKIWRKTLKHIVFLLMATVVAHIFISYFVSIPELFAMMRQSPTEHMSTFIWIFVLTGIMYFNFAWFREQMCLIICPYGRLQSVMTDKDTVIIGYDSNRGEPRGKASDSDSADCVDCGRCVAVCPTGIDIRNGLQLDCIGCAACIDACDEIMVKLKRPKGLVRYDSLRKLVDGESKFWRPRLALYAVLGVIGLVVATFGFRAHTTFEAGLARLGGVPFVVEADGRVQNLYEIHVINKQSATHTYEIRPLNPEDFEYVIAIPDIELKGGKGQRVPIFVYSIDGNNATEVKLSVKQVDGENTEDDKVINAPFLRPR